MSRMVGAFLLPGSLLILYGSTRTGNPNVTLIKEVRGYVGGKVNIDCPYPADYIHVAKYWCQDPCKDADVLVKSEKSDTYISKGRFSLYDNSNGRSFRVTIKKLTLEDAGMYYCGVAKWGKDIYTEVHVNVSEGIAMSLSSPQVCYMATVG
uniref:Ig-like domain-containing protein n=1 Tax=Paramormyrops kingsleyae TaxID=1676925 RepID=A0A3B3TA08_9TELE